VSDSNTEQKRELECQRLASDLTQMSKETFNPDLKAHCLRMAGFWSNRLFSGLTEDTAPQNYLLH
jgi:hypothetical protein